MIWVLGAGGIGASAAARLAAVTEVAVVDTWPDNVAAIRDHGLTLDDPNGSATVALPAALVDDVATGRAELPAPDVVLVCLKSFQTDAVLQAVAPRVPDGVPFVSLQNGLNEDRIAAVVGGERTIGAVVRFEGALAGPGHAVQKKTDGPLTVGELDGRRSERVVTLADRLGRAIPTDVTTEITVELWSKLLRNCMLNPVAAVSGLGLHGMGTSRVAPGICADVGREGAMVAAALGIRIDPPTLYGADPAALVAGDATAHDAAVAGFVRTYSPQPEVQPSMLQDVLKGRGTEIDFLNGEVAARGRALGVPTPVNDALTALVHAVERGERAPGPGLLEEVAGARIA